MAYQVLARKWRPQQFQEVVGQEHVVQTLSRAIRSNRVAHAYLFVGPRGTGKTTSARLLAKALNCSGRGDDPNPCDRCDSCREIVQGNNLDVIEIDGASNNGVEQVRELRENVRYSPARGPYKIIIIDEVHMLSSGAFNALLKTLEEPPAHAKFLLATTDVHKVPVTILSRCQRFDLRRIGIKEIVGRLEEIAKAEKWKVSDAAMLAIARGAEGGLRDAESALDQIVSFQGETVEESDVLGVFGLVSWTTLDRLGTMVLSGDSKGALKVVAELDEGGRDLQRLLQDLLGHFRNVLVWLHAPELAGSFDLTDTQIEGLKAQAKLADGEKLLRVLEILTEAANQAKYALSRRTVVEVALLKAARAASVVSIDELIAQIRASLADDDAPASSAVEPDLPAPNEEGRVAEPAPSGYADPEPREPAEEEVARLRSRWKAVLAEVGETAQLAAPYLTEAEALRVEGDHVVLGFDPEFEEHLKRVETPRCIKALEHAIGHELRRTVGIRFVLEDRPKVAFDGLAQGAAAAPPPPPRVEGRGLPIARWSQDPLVKQTMKEFDADLFEVRE
jgi:DNA polymerase III subunit gamma/tau